MNETVNFWKLFFCFTRISRSSSQTDSNETSSLRQTKYCQTEWHLYEIVTIKKQNRYYSQKTITYLLFVTVKIYIYLNLDILLIFLSTLYCAHHQHFVMTFSDDWILLTGKSRTKFILEIRNQDGFQIFLGFT